MTTVETIIALATPVSAGIGSVIGHLVRERMLYKWASDFRQWAERLRLHVGFNEPSPNAPAIKEKQ